MENVRPNRYKNATMKVRTWSILDETVLILQMAGLVARLGLDGP